jgi:osmotically inducible protein OsmC
MATFSRTVTVDWAGSIMEGKGVAKAGTGAFTLPVTFPSRIGEPAGNTSPEELLAAAHAACYAMALNATLGRKGGSAARTVVTATVSADKGESGIKLTTSKLKVVAEGLQGIEKSQFNEVAKAAEAGCPISNAIRGSLQIDVETEVK